MKSLFSETPKNKFVAFYSDGSGSVLLKRNGNSCLSADGEAVYWTHKLLDSGFLWYIDLPDDFELWFEKKMADNWFNG